MNKFSSPNEFSLYIETSAKHNKISYIDAIIEYCDTHMIEPKEVTKYINSSLKEKLVTDYKELNYLTKIPTLNL